METKAVNKKTWIIIGVVVALLAVLGVGGYALSRGSAGREESMLELGQRYLDELNYEQAVACFTSYLEIDPKSVEAYIGLAEAYIGLEEYAKALEVLEKGYAETGDESLLELRSRIEEEYIDNPIESELDESTEEIPELEEEFVGPLVLDASTESPVVGNGGVIVTMKNQLFGAINYQGKEIVPHTYELCWAGPTDDGFFAMGDYKAAHVFNAQGQEVLVIEDPVYLYISDGGVLYLSHVPYQIKWYDLIQGSTTDMGECNGGMSQMWDGAAYWFGDYDENLNPTIVNGTKEGAKKIFYSGGGIKWSLGPRADGYLPFTGGTGWEETGEIGLLRETDGKEYCIVYGDSDAINRAYSGLPGGVLQGNAMFLTEYYRDGMPMYNKGTQMVLQVESWDDTIGRDEENNLIYYYLLDLSNAKLGVYQAGTAYEREVVTNPNDLILAQYDYIQLSDSGYYLASDGESWFYLDEKGKKIDQTFLDCSAFYNGYAIVLDTDGMAYLIDKEFNKVSEGYPADSVSTAEAVFFAYLGDKITILTAPEE